MAESIDDTIELSISVIPACNDPTGTPRVYTGKEIKVSIVYFWDYPATSSYQPTLDWKEIIAADLNNVTDAISQCPRLTEYAGYGCPPSSVRCFFNRILPEPIWYNCTFYGPIMIDWNHIHVDTDYHRYRYAMQIWHRQDSITAEEAYNNSDITIVIVDGEHMNYQGFADVRSGTISLSMFLTDALLYFPGSQVASNPAIRKSHMYVLAHEISHLYRAPDHVTGYRRPDYDPALADEVNCVMGDYTGRCNSGLSSFSTLCNYCKKVILPYPTSVWHLQKFWPLNEYWLEGSSYITET